jgi:MFS superfamily sulfate permease-like transporter
VGFKSGVALYLAITQLPKLFGMPGSDGDFWRRGHHFMTHIDEANAVALIVGVIALALLAVGKRLAPNRPVALLVVVLGIASSALIDVSQYGVRTLGQVPQGVPQLGLPAIGLQDLNALLPLAMACFLLSAVQTAAIGRMYAQKHGYRIDNNQEFLALAVANLAAGVGRGYPVSGGLSQSLVNEDSGARTPLSGLIAAGLMLLVVLFLSDLLRHLPQPVLAAIVLFACTGLLNIAALKRLWHFNRGEFLVAMAALLGVMGSGLLRGVLIGMVLSLLLLLRRSSTPHTAELGRVPGTHYFADLHRDPNNEREPAVFVFRADSALLYFNASYVSDRLFERLASRNEKDVKLVVFFMGSSPNIDLAGVDMLEQLRRSFTSRGVSFRIAEARGNVRDALQRAGYGGKEGVVAHQTVRRVIESWRAEGGTLKL